MLTDLLNFRKLEKSVVSDGKLFQMLTMRLQKKTCVWWSWYTAASLAYIDGHIYFDLLSTEL